MPVRIEKLPDEPICILTYTDPFEPQNEMRDGFAQVARYLDQLEGQGYAINDLTNLTLNFSISVLAMAEGMRGGPGSAADPRVKHLLVSTHSLMQMVKGATHQKQYGGLDVPIFASVEEALAYVRERLAVA